MKWIVRLLGLVVLVACLLVAGVLLLPGERLARLASEQLSAQLGREVVVEGDVSLAFWPTLSVSTGAITVANAPGFSGTPLLAADGAQLGLDAAKLMSGEVQVTQLIAERPRILLQERTDGSANWIFGGAGSAGAGGGTGGGISSVAVERVQISDASFRFEREGAAPVALQDIDIDLTWPNRAGPADITLALAPAGTPVAISASLATPAGLLTGGAHPVRATLRTTGGEASFDGRMSLTPEMAGAFTTNLSDTRAFLAALGIGGVDLPEGAGRRIEATGDATYTSDGRISLRGLRATLDTHTLGGDADVVLTAPRPRLTAQLASGPLTLGAAASGGGGAGRGGTGGGWSKTPIAADALALMDAEVSLTAPSIKVGGLSFGKARLLLTIDRARAVFGIRELAAYDGALKGQFVMNNRNGLSVGGELIALGVNTGTLLADADLTDRVQGSADAELKFLGVGENMDTIMRSLSGQGAIKMGRGVITGINLDQLFRAGGAGGGTTVFDQAVASFDIKDGVLRNDNLLMTIPDGEARGEGKVNLGGQTINYTFTPKSLKARGGEGLAIPVTIKGPWADPRIDADLAAALDLNLKEEREAFEDRVRDEVSERLSKELDVEVKEDDTLKDVLRRKLEDEARRGLQNLLGGGD